MAIGWMCWIMRPVGGEFGAVVPLLRELGAGLTGATAHGLLPALVRHAVLLATAALLMLACCAGGAMTGWIRSGVRRDRLPLSILFGWGLLAFAGFGLALAGLYSAPVLWFLLFGFVIGGGRWLILRIRRISFGDHDSAPVFPRWLPWLIALPAILFLPLLLVPPIYVDLSQYHLAAPERFLRQHRFVLEGANSGFHLQLTAEMVNGYAVLLGNDALAVFTSMIPFAAGLTLALMRVGKLAGGSAGWIAAALAVSSHWWFVALGTGKNDPAAAGLIVAASVMMVARASTASALLWGLAAAVKPNGLAFAGIGWIAHELFRPRRSRAPDWRWLAFFGLPLVPWLLKGWLFRGDPLWIVFSRWLPGAMWDERSVAVGRMVMARQGDAWEIVAGLLTSIRDLQPGLALAMVVLLFGWRHLPRELRRLYAFGVACVFAYVLVVGYQADRMIYPALIVCGFASAGALAIQLRDSGRLVRLAVTAALCLAAWAPAAGAIRLSAYRHSTAYLLGTLDDAGFHQAVLTTVRETQEAFRDVRGVRSVLLIGDHAPYGWPGRVLTEETFDRSPTWVLTREAADLPRLLIRLRQLDISHLAMNFIAESHVAPAGGAARAFGWLPRQVVLLERLMRAHAPVEIAPAHCDAINGGYYVWRIERAPAPPAPWVLYLPGIKELLWEMYEPYLLRRDTRTSLARARQLVGAFPGVGVFQMSAGLFAQAGGDWKAAYDSYRQAIDAGMISDYGHGLLADVCVKLNREEEAIRYYASARRIFNRHLELIDAGEAGAHAQLAFRLTKTGRRLPEALAHAEAAVRLAPGRPGGRLARAEVLLAMGRRADAIAAFQDIRRDWRSDSMVRLRAEEGLERSRGSSRRRPVSRVTPAR